MEYIEPRKLDKQIICYNCLQVGGHVKYQCPNKTVCKKCRSTEHIMKKCPQIQCFNCKQLGHFKTECPLIIKWNKTKDAKEKKVKRKKKRIECYKCLNEGHYAKACPNKRKCTNCGSAEHSFMKCPRLRCNNCFAFGHIAAYCN